MAMVGTYNHCELGELRSFVTLPLKLGKLETQAQAGILPFPAIITTPAEFFY